MTIQNLSCSLLLTLFCCMPASAFQEEVEATQEETKSFKVADDQIEFSYPVSWEKKEPRVNIIEAELLIPKSEDDENDGRLTIMGAGGSVEANIDRWKTQFSQDDGSSTDDATKVEEKEIAGAKVHLVDISGTFSDRRGPVAPAVERENYRMLAAIIETEIAGNYFVKFYGPAKTVEENEKRFHKMLKSMKIKAED